MESVERLVEQLKVSAKSNPKSVAGALTGSVQKNGRVEVRIIGAGALNQAVKALAIARKFADQNGSNLICMPDFMDIEMDDGRKTGIKLTVEYQKN